MISIKQMEDSMCNTHVHVHFFEEFVNHIFHMKFDYKYIFLQFKIVHVTSFLLIHCIMYTKYNNTIKIQVSVTGNMILPV